MAERELYQIYQLFFTSRYTQLTELDLDLELGTLEPEYIKLAQSYQIRSLLALEKYDEALGKLDPATDSVLAKFISFLKQGSFTSTEELDSFFSDTSSVEGSLYKSIYFILVNNYETALDVLNDQSVDDISLGSFINLKQGKLKEANLWFKKFPSSLKDTFIYNLTSSWFELLNFGDSLNSSYYHYDELASNESTNSIKSLCCLFVANLKLLHFPEAKEVLTKIDLLLEENPQSDFLSSWESDLLIDKIAYKLLTNDEEFTKSTEDLLTELKTLDPSNEYLADLTEKNEVFDSIVLKYKV